MLPKHDFTSIVQSNNNKKSADSLFIYSSFCVFVVCVYCLFMVLELLFLKHTSLVVKLQRMHCTTTSFTTTTTTTTTSRHVMV